MTDESDSLDIQSPESYVTDLVDSIPVASDSLAATLVNEGRSFDSFIQPDTTRYQAAVSLSDIVDPMMKRCYDNCRHAATVGDRVPAEVRYCEGYASLGTLPPLRHAWILVDGKVAEITAPDRRERVIPPADSEYFGVTMPPAQAGVRRGP